MIECFTNESAKWIFAESHISDFRNAKRTTTDIRKKSPRYYRKERDLMQFINSEQKYGKYYVVTKISYLQEHHICEVSEILYFGCEYNVEMHSYASIMTYSRTISTILCFKHGFNITKGYQEQQIHWLPIINVDLAHLYPSTSWNLACCHVINLIFFNEKWVILKFCTKSLKSQFFGIYCTALWFNRLALIIFFFFCQILVNL